MGPSVISSVAARALIGAAARGDADASTRPHRARWVARLASERGRGRPAPAAQPTAQAVAERPASGALAERDELGPWADIALAGDEQRRPGANQAAERPDRVAAPPAHQAARHEHQCNPVRSQAQHLAARARCRAPRDAKGRAVVAGPTRSLSLNAEARPAATRTTAFRLYEGGRVVKSVWGGSPGLRAWGIDGRRAVTRRAAPWGRAPSGA
jgi:hypothetical protein